MKNYCFLFLLFFIVQKGIAQSWVPLGTNEQTSNAIATTLELTFFTAVSNNGVPYVSYIDDAGGPNNVGDFKGHVRRFINGSWAAVGDGFSPSFPSPYFFPVALDEDTLYAAYAEGLNPVDIQYRPTVKRLNNSNNQWETVGQRAFSDSVVSGMDMAVANRKIYIAYLDGSVDGRVTVKYFDNANPANGWQTLGTEGISDEPSENLNLVIDNGIPYVAYIEFGNHNLFIKKFNGTAWENAGTNAPAGPAFITSFSLKFNSQHIPYVAFVNDSSTIFVHKLNNLNAWVPVGNNIPYSFVFPVISLAVLGDVPFVAFAERDNAGIAQVTVKKYNSSGSTWADAGNQPVTQSTESPSYISLITDRLSKLYVVYQNFGTRALYAKSFDASGILPVTLTGFTVTKVKDASLLQWTTANELNNKLFEPEHSTDAKTFAKIGEVAATGNTNIQQHYSFIHASPVTGINYYRLKQVDLNGNYSYSKTISISFGQQQPLLALSPNPAQNVLHVSYIPVGVKEIIIYNAAGKTIKHIQIDKSSVDINVAALSAGSYFVRFYGDATNETKMFVK